MSIATLFLLAVGLSMDAFAVAVCKGLAMQRLTLKSIFTVGAYFGIFQAGMPLLGYFLGSTFESRVVAIDHWIAFILLGAIGVNMIRESLGKDEEKVADASLSFKTMLILAIATSIDALAVGITFAFLHVRIFYAVTFIGVVTFLLSMLGVKVGNLFGVKYKSRAELAGGVVLIVLGTKILLEHLGVINF
jgi:manganese efflux pump family protein